MILHTPLFEFCDNNLYGENLVIIRKEFPEISFFQNKYTWSDVKKLIKNIKAGTGINLHDYIKSEAMTEQEKIAYENDFKMKLINALVYEGLPEIHFDKNVTFHYRGETYTADVRTLITLFDLKRFNGISNSDQITYTYAIRNTPSTIVVTNSKNNKLECITVQHRMTDILLSLIEIKHNEYNEILHHLFEYIVNYQLKTEDDIVTLYKNLYDVDIYSDKFRYQNIPLDMIKL